MAIAKLKEKHDKKTSKLKELAEELQEKVKEKETEATNLNEKLISLTEAVSLKD